MPAILAKQGGLEVGENGGQNRRTLKTLFAEEFQLANCATVDRDFGLLIEPRGITSMNKPRL